MYDLNGTDFTHKKSWMVLEEVDGLKNEDVVMLVTSTYAQEFRFLRERFTSFNLMLFSSFLFRIIPSSRTWMRMLANVFVSVEGNLLSERLHY